MPKSTITAESIAKVLEEQKPQSISQVYRLLGHAGSIPGSTAKRIRELVPDIDEKLKDNKGSRLAASGKSGKKSATKRYPRSPTNPFRDGSGYGLVFDILAAHRDGIAKEKLIEVYAKASRKNLKRAGYDVAVLLSAKNSKAGERHRSCADGFWVERENSFLRLRTD